MRSEPVASTIEETSPSMVVVRVQLEVKEDSVDAFVAYLQQEREAVLQMEGALRYKVFGDPIQPTHFILYEEWASKEAFEAYQASENFRQSFAVLGPMMAGPPDSAYYAAERVGP